MSYQTVDQVIEHYRGGPAKKLVLLVVAQHDGGDGCWASVPTIAELTGLSCRCVQRSLADLHAVGVLERTERRGRTTVYRVRVDALGHDPRQCDTPEPVTGDGWQGVTPPPNLCHPTPEPVSPEPVTEPVNEPTPEPGGEADDAGSVREAARNRITLAEASALVEQYGKERTVSVIRAIDSNPPARGIKNLNSLLRFRLDHGEGEEAKHDRRPPKRSPCPVCDGMAHVLNENDESERCTACKGTGYA